MDILSIWFLDFHVDLNTLINLLGFYYYLIGIELEEPSQYLTTTMIVK